MRPEELMIGDWVVGPNKIPFQIGVIDRDFLHWDEIEPVHLTPEVLEKNGFTLQKPENHIETVYCIQNISSAVADEMYALWPEKDSFYLVLRVDCKDMVRMSVKYIHQLQHALRLCGINKEIEL